jgi:hypothetical protein
VICVRREWKYFCEGDWTGQISLMRHEKSDFTRSDKGALSRAAEKRLRTVEFARERRIYDAAGDTFIGFNVTIRLTHAFSFHPP